MATKAKKARERKKLPFKVRYRNRGELPGVVKSSW